MIAKRAVFRAVALSAALALVAAACGGDGGDGDQTETPGAEAPTGGTIIHGTTDTIVSLDPAGSYDLGSWQIIFQTFDGLLQRAADGSLEHVYRDRGIELELEATGRNAHVVHLLVRQELTREVHRGIPFDDHVPMLEQEIIEPDREVIRQAMATV